MVDKVVKAFDISLDMMEKMVQSLTAEFICGLSEEGEHVKVKMLLTFVHSIPNGTEEGDFIALDLGGSNFRVGKISIKGGKLPDDLDVKKYEINKAIMQSTQEELFDFVADCVADFIKTRDIKEKLPLGFTFSFPVKNSSLNSGILIRWTKCFDAKGAVGRDPVKMLQEAFNRKGVVNIDTKALISDTTGTLLAVAGKDVPDCHIGLILGTGTNACYMERFDKVTIPKFGGDFQPHSGVVINCEWGAFGEVRKQADIKGEKLESDNGRQKESDEEKKLEGAKDRLDEVGKGGPLETVLTQYDKQLDTLVVNKGEQLFEKMISGKYLGEIVRLALKGLVKDGLLFDGKSSELFDTFEEFKSAYVSDIEMGSVDDCKKLLKDKLSIEASEKDCEIVKRVCDAVSTRAARLAATAVVALVKKIDKLGGCTVAVDGTLYREHPNFDIEMRRAMDQLAPGNNIKMKLSTDGSGRGAAMAAAMACRSQ